MLVLSFVFAGLTWAPTTAAAQIFKYRQADGTVAYTDQLSDLPAERRAYYNRLLAERAKRDEEAAKAARQTDAEIRAAEAERARLARQRMAEQEQRRRLAEMDRTIDALKERNRQRDAAKAKWKKRVEQTRAALSKKLAAYRTTKQEWASLAIRADYTLFPGQVEKKQELQARMRELEAEVDQLVEELQVNIPEQARKEGVPPGWLR